MHLPCSWVVNIGGVPQRNYGILFDVHAEFTVIDLTAGGAIMSIGRDMRADLRIEKFAVLSAMFSSGDTQTIMNEAALFLNTGGSLATPTT